MSSPELTDLSDANHLHDRGFLLPLREASSLFTVRVDTTKGFAVLVKHRHLPVMVLSPSVFHEYCALPTYHLWKYITLNDPSPNNPLSLPVISCCAPRWEQEKSCYELLSRLMKSFA